jgi:hypothetical protein
MKLKIDSPVPSQGKLKGKLEYSRNLSLFLGVVWLPRKKLHLKPLNVKITLNRVEVPYMVLVEKLQSSNWIPNTPVP